MVEDATPRPPDPSDPDRAWRGDSVVLELGPDNINALMHRGLAFGGKGDFDKGFADLNRAIELFDARTLQCFPSYSLPQPTFPLVHYDVGRNSPLKPIRNICARGRLQT